MIARPDQKNSGADSDAGFARKVSVRASAKINLFLHVGDKRSDGYHALESLIVFAETSDRIEITPAPDLKLKIAGPLAKALIRDSDSGAHAPGEISARRAGRAYRA